MIPRSRVRQDRDKPAERTRRRAGVAASLVTGPAAFLAARLAACLAAFLAAGTPARAELLRVYELFTSQGCSKCPPADRLIADLARHPDTVALTYPVNTWDYIGWKDTLASQAFTARQHAYAAVRGDRLVFTPQVIVDGLAPEAGADRQAILHDADTLSGRRGAMSVPLALTEVGTTLDVLVGAAPAGLPVDLSAGVYVLRVARSLTVAIGRGENSGREVTYTNVVRAMSRIGTWTGKEVRFSVPELAGDDEGHVILLQSDRPGQPGVILAAAKTAGL